MAQVSTSIPSNVLMELRRAGAIFEESDFGTNMIVTQLGSPASDVYKAWVSSLHAGASDPAVGCVVAPHPSIAMTTLAPSPALYGPIQVSCCSVATSLVLACPRIIIILRLHLL